MNMNLIPYVFVISPVLVLIGAMWEKVALTLWTALLDMTALGNGLTRFWTTHLK